jgi:hypothetical protein
LLAAYESGIHADSQRKPRLPNDQKTVGQPYAAIIEGDERYDAIVPSWCPE